MKYSFKIIRCYPVSSSSFQWSQLQGFESSSSPEFAAAVNWFYVAAVSAAAVVWQSKTENQHLETKLIHLLLFLTSNNTAFLQFLFKCSIFFLVISSAKSVSTPVLAAVLPIPSVAAVSPAVEQPYSSAQNELLAAAPADQRAGLSSTTTEAPSLPDSLGFL